MRYEKRSLDTKKSERTTLIYYPEMNEDIDVVAYTFKNDKLESAFVSMTMHGNDTQALQMMTNFMSERYFGDGISSAGYVYMNATTTESASKFVYVTNTTPGYEGITAALYIPRK